MLIKVQYTSNEHKAGLIEEYSDKQLVEDQILVEGGFLTFSTEVVEESKVFITVDNETLDDLKQRQDATDDVILQLLMEGVKV